MAPRTCDVQQDRFPGGPRLIKGILPPLKPYDLVQGIYRTKEDHNDIITLEPITLTMSRTAASVKRMRPESQILSPLQDALSNRTSDQALKSVVQLLRKNSDYYDWVGIYLVERDKLVLAAYAGEAETEHVTIPIGQGICGLAAKQGATIIVPDVSKDSRYLMCFPSTKSEIVIPIKGATRVLGEIDIDSNRISAFTPRDRKMLEETAAMLATYLQSHRSTP
jgi:L-methionine (R)-S-oxide reductase